LENLLFERSIYLITMEDNNATYKDKFASDRRYFKGFHAKIELIFMLHPDRFENETTKKLFISFLDSTEKL